MKTLKMFLFILCITAILPACTKDFHAIPESELVTRSTSVELRAAESAPEEGTTNNNTPWDRR